MHSRTHSFFVQIVLSTTQDAPSNHLVNARHSIKRMSGAHEPDTRAYRKKGFWDEVLDPAQKKVWRIFWGSEGGGGGL